jgi:hypothetical protein
VTTWSTAFVDDVIAPAPCPVEVRPSLVRRAAESWVRPIATALAHSKRDAIPIAALSVLSIVGTIGAPGLTHHPLLLILLSARLPFLALAAPHISFLSFVTIGALRLGAADPFHFRIGRRLGDELHIPKPSGPLARFVLRFGVMGAVLIWPVGRHLMAAGATDQRPRAVAAADLLGTVTYLIAVYYLGKTFL